MEAEKVLRVLITGFKYFNGEKDNASEKIARSFSGLISEKFSITVLIMPVEWGPSRNMLLCAIKKEKPDIIVSLGRSYDVRTLELEPVLINYSSDNDEAGKPPPHPYIIKNGPVQYKINFPLKKIKQFLKKNGIPALINEYPDLSMTYLCGYVAYLSRYYADKYCDKNAITIFVHVPALKGAPAGELNFNEAIKGIKLIIEFLAALRLKNKK